MTDTKKLIEEARGRAGSDMGLSDQLLRELADALEAAEGKVVWHTKRADKAWTVINSDHWRNRYDEDMARGNAYVAILRGRLRAVLGALKDLRAQDGA